MLDTDAQGDVENVLERPVNARGRLTQGAALCISVQSNRSYYRKSITTRHELVSKLGDLVSLYPRRERRVIPNWRPCE